MIEVIHKVTLLKLTMVCSMVEALNQVVAGVSHRFWRKPPADVPLWLGSSTNVAPGSVQPSSPGCDLQFPY